jgi:hypothetical protein
MADQPSSNVYVVAGPNGLDTDRFVLDPETFDRIEQEATSS